LQRGAGHLGGVDHAVFEQVPVLAGRRIQARARPERADLLNYDFVLVTRVTGDDFERLLEATLDNDR
jgi:hypothetical protein